MSGDPLISSSEKIEVDRNRLRFPDVPDKEVRDAFSLANELLALVCRMGEVENLHKAEKSQKVAFKR